MMELVGHSIYLIARMIEYFKDRAELQHEATAPQTAH